MEQRANSLSRMKVKWKQGEPFYRQVAFKHILDMGYCRAGAAWAWGVWTNHSTSFMV